MELSAQLEARQAQLDLEWIPREFNQEADDLSNELLHGFDPQLRIPVDPGKMGWLYMDDLMEQGVSFFQEMRRKKGKSSHGAFRKLRLRRRQDDKLRVRDPWGD